MNFKQYIKEEIEPILIEKPYIKQIEKLKNGMTYKMTVNKYATYDLDDKHYVFQGVCTFQNIKPLTIDDNYGQIYLLDYHVKFGARVPKANFDIEHAHIQYEPHIAPSQNTATMRGMVSDTAGAYLINYKFDNEKKGMRWDTRKEKYIEYSNKDPYFLLRNIENIDDMGDCIEGRGLEVWKTLIDALKKVKILSWYDSKNMHKLNFSKFIKAYREDKNGLGFTGY